MRTEVKIDSLNNMPIGTIFKFETYDNEENTYWTFHYCKSKDGFIYLGGGIDFGMGIGKVESPEDVLEYVNDSSEPKIDVLVKT